MRNLRLVVMLCVLATVGCSEKDRLIRPAPPSRSLDELLSAPDSLLVDGTKISVELFLNRDFQPDAPREGRPLDAIALLNGSPPDTFPASVSDVYIWVIRDRSQVWGAVMGFQGIDWSRNGARNYLAAGGPFWDPGIVVDVVIGVRASSGKVSLALFRDVLIHESS